MTGDRPLGEGGVGGIGDVTGHVGGGLGPPARLVVKYGGYCLRVVGILLSELMIHY